MTLSLLTNHLWQSSGFAVLAGLVAFSLRRNSAKVRYWVWLSASLKFFLPFALLVNLGSLVPRPASRSVLHSVATPAFSDAVVQIVEPFSAASGAVAPAHDSLRWVPVAVAVVWALGFLAIAVSRLRGWLRVRAAVHAGAPIELPIPVRAVVTSGAESRVSLAFFVLFSFCLTG